jgi:hypothetical protein
VQKSGFQHKESALNRSFSTAANRPPGALKNRPKILFIQQLDGRDFALGAMRLSWHKYKRFSPLISALIRDHLEGPS